MELHKKFTFAIIIFIILLVGGIYFYSSVEEWRYIDSAYFTVATVTTVGYGDFVPETDIGKIFTMFFSFFGIGMALYFFTLVGRYIYRKQLFAQLKNSKKIRGYKGTRLVKNESK
ncbi:MAG: potassium channel family protein [Nanoarchaeota archaeon]|nr:potassium channel family protein [Nanoarchaeota archaeon]